MKRSWIVLLAICLVGCQQEKVDIESENQEIAMKEEIKQTEVVINQEVLTINLENNTTVDSWLESWPMSVTMKDLNSNEKYYYTNTSLPTHQNGVHEINSGDVMLFGNNCVVIFYKSFTTSYSYTRLGKIEDVATLESLMEKEEVEVLFRK